MGRSQDAAKIPTKDRTAGHLPTIITQHKMAIVQGLRDSGFEKRRGEE